MNHFEAFKVALQSLWANKLRSALTLLGVVLGVASVIAIVTFVNGINGYVSERIFNLGADVFIVAKGKNVVTNIDDWLERQRRKDLTLEDYAAVRDGCHSCKLVGASVNYSSGHVAFGGQSTTDTGIRGWTPSMAGLYDLEIAYGRFMADGDMGRSSHVAIIGYDIYDKLLKGVDPIGQEVRVDGEAYTVIGVGVKQGKTLGQSRDNWVMLPITTWFRQYGAKDNSIRMWGKGFDVGTPMETAMDEVRVILRARRHDAPGAKDSFQIDTNSTFLSLWASISDNFFAVMVGLASISLVIGGIVIMNVMLVSVTERTREIGIRKALGARKRDVLLQFLIESSTMALVGGVIGILFGISVAKTVTILIGMPSTIKLWAVMAGVIVSTSVGVFFGVYPARKAADLDPIAALRFEL